MEHEYIAIVPELFNSDRTMTIGVDKAGGGTLGLYYTGTWAVAWYDDGELRDSAELSTGSRKRHDHVAAIAGQFFTDMFDTDEDHAVYDRVQSWADTLLG